MWLRALVALTCVVVIAGVSYWFWNDQTDRRSAAALSLAQSQRATCLDWLKKMPTTGEVAKPVRDSVTECLSSQHLTREDMSAHFAN